VRAGSLAVIGAGAHVGEGTVVENAVVGAGAVVGGHASVLGSIVGDEAVLGSHCEVKGLAVLGPGAQLGDGNVLDHGLRVGAGQSIPERALQFS
jgi:mannose-1-phosphate guanylyltransferase